MQKSGKCWYQNRGITVDRMFVKACSYLSWVDYKLLIESRGHDLLARDPRITDCSEERIRAAMFKKQRRHHNLSLRFALEGKAEWSCWPLAKASRFKVGSPSLPPSPGDAGVSQGPFIPIQKSESTSGDSSSPVWFTSAGVAPTATENRYMVRWGCIRLWFI